MNVRGATLGKLVRIVRRTPLHPQWLLGDNAMIGEWISSEARGRVLDVGCADRWIQSRLREGCEYIGLDYPVTGRGMYGARPDVFGDAGRLPVRDACVDTVVMLEVLEHLRNPREAMVEAARVLNPGGGVLLSMPFLYPIHDAPHDYQRLTVHGLLREAEAAGLRVDAIRSRLGSMGTAGLIACLSLGGGAMQAFKKRSPALLLAPLLLLGVPVVNLLAWIGDRLLPSWGAITNGYLLTARKP